MWRKKIIKNVDQQSYSTVYGIKYGKASHMVASYCTYTVALASHLTVRDCILQEQCHEIFDTFSIKKLHWASHEQAKTVLRNFSFLRKNS